MSLYEFMAMLVIIVIVIILVSTSALLEKQNKLSKKIDELIKQIKEKEGNK